MSCFHCTAFQLLLSRGIAMVKEVLANLKKSMNEPFAL